MRSKQTREKPQRGNPERSVEKTEAVAKNVFKGSDSEHQEEGTGQNVQTAHAWDTGSGGRDRRTVRCAPPAAQRTAGHSSGQPDTRLLTDRPGTAKLRPGPALLNAGKRSRPL